MCLKMIGGKQTENWNSVEQMESPFLQVFYSCIMSSLAL